MSKLCLLPRKKGVVFLITIFLLGFLSGSAALFILAVNNPEKINYEIYRYKFAYLRLTRKLITTKDIDGDRVSIYSERSGGKTVELINFDKLETIVRKAYEDFPVFITGKYGILMPPPEYNRYDSLSITFVREETYSSYNNIDGSKSHGLAYRNEIYLRSMNFKYRIATNERLIRHEVFHYLANKYGMAKFLPHPGAYEFGRLKLINFPKK